MSGSYAHDRSPTPGLFLGLIITLAAVVAYSGYITRQVYGLRELQNNLVDRNRKDSLQLLRIQNDLNSLGLAMRDMLDNEEPYPLTAWSAQFQRVRTDLDDALRRERQVAPVDRSSDQKQYLESSVAQFWDAADRTFALAQGLKQEEARTQIRISLRARQEALSTAVSRLLVQNNESEEQATQQIGQIYDRVQRQKKLDQELSQLANIVFEDGAQRGYGKHISSYLKKLVDLKKENTTEHDQLISTNEQYKNLLTMFPDWTDAKNLQRKYEAADVGPFMAVAGTLGQDGEKEQCRIM